MNQPEIKTQNFPSITLSEPGRKKKKRFSEKKILNLLLVAHHSRQQKPKNFRLAFCLPHPPLTPLSCPNPQQQIYDSF